MKKLIVARHGPYGHDDKLNVEGRIKVAELAEKLRPFVNGGGRTLILSSTRDRATQSAEILGKAFGVGFEKHEVLWSENGHREDLPKALELVRARKGEADVLILVTHLEYAERFPGFFSQQELGQTLQAGRIEKGEAAVINCEAPSITLVK